MSIAPGPTAPHAGTWDAPKWPPRAQWRRLRGSACAWANGDGLPAGHSRGTCQESSQPMIGSTPDSGPSVNGSHANATTAIWTQTRPSVPTVEQALAPRSSKVLTGPAEAAWAGLPSLQPARSAEIS
jgi:hypothetical protein